MMGFHVRIFEYIHQRTPGLWLVHRPRCWSRRTTSAMCWNSLTIDFRRNNRFFRLSLATVLFLVVLTAIRLLGQPMTVQKNMLTSINKSPIRKHFDDSSIEAKIRGRISCLVETTPACRGKEEFLRIIFSADDSTATENTESSDRPLCHRLPFPKDVAEQYGSTPIIFGLETCAAYRSLLVDDDGNAVKPMPRVAGLYHTATNSLARSFETNIERIVDPFSLMVSPYNVPWGKHVSPDHRWENTWPTGNPDEKTRVLPIVLIRDPFHWMQSMVRANALCEFCPFHHGFSLSSTVQSPL